MEASTLELPNVPDDSVPATAAVNAEILATSDPTPSSTNPSWHNKKNLEAPRRVYKKPAKTAVANGTKPVRKPGVRTPRKIKEIIQSSDNGFVELYCQTPFRCQQKMRLARRTLRKTTANVVRAVGLEAVAEYQLRRFTASLLSSGKLKPIADENGIKTENLEMTSTDQTAALVPGEASANDKVLSLASLDDDNPEPADWVPVFGCVFCRELQNSLPQPSSLVTSENLRQPVAGYGGWSSNGEPETSTPVHPSPQGPKDAGWKTSAHPKPEAKQNGDSWYPFNLLEQFQVRPRKTSLRPSVSVADLLNERQQTKESIFSPPFYSSQPSSLYNIGFGFPLVPSGISLSALHDSSYWQLAQSLGLQSALNSETVQTVPETTLDDQASTKRVRRYSVAELTAAIKEVEKGEVGTRKAALLYGIPRSTLRNKVGKLPPKKRSSKALARSLSADQGNTLTKVEDCEVFHMNPKSADIQPNSSFPPQPEQPSQDLPPTSASPDAKFTSKKQNLTCALKRIISRHLSEKSLPLGATAPPPLLSRSRSDSNKNDTLYKRSKATDAARNKRGRYRRYNLNDLEDALQKVRNGEMTVHRAGHMFGIPHSTLEYKMKERGLVAASMSPDPIMEQIETGKDLGAEAPNVRFSKTKRTIAKKSSKFYGVDKVLTPLTSQAPEDQSTAVKWASPADFHTALDTLRAYALQSNSHNGMSSSDGATQEQGELSMQNQDNPFRPWMASAAGADYQEADPTTFRFQLLKRSNTELSKPRNKKLKRAKSMLDPAAGTGEQPLNLSVSRETASGEDVSVEASAPASGIDLHVRNGNTV